MEQCQSYWNKCLEIFKDNLSGTAFRTWFAPITPIQYTDNILVLQVKSQYIVEYIEDNYIDLLKRTLVHVFGKGIRLEYRVLIDSQSGTASTIPSEGVMNQLPTAAQSKPFHTPYENNRAGLPKIDPQLNSNYTFNSFVEGECNRLPRTAGMSVAQNPGKTVFNPLFIYGGSGVGKTHLATAIGNQVLAAYPNARVLYVTATTFEMQYRKAVVENETSDFINFYQNIDVLIVDDIQYWADKKATQNTFFCIFNHLHQLGKQLILTSDKSPMELHGLEDRLITRFKWGLLAEIKRPDFQLRKDILRSRMYRDGIEMSDEIVDFIADNVKSNIRDLEGVLASLLAYSTLTDKQIDMDLAKEVVGRIAQITNERMSIEGITTAVCSHFNLTEKVLFAKTRKHEIVTARQVAMYLAKRLTDYSLNEIGIRMGNRNHATVLHSVKTISDMMQYDAVLRQSVHQIENALKA